MQKGREDLWTYFAGSYVDGSDDVLWLRDPTGRREVSFVYDSARHRIVEGNVKGFDHKDQARTATISINSTMRNSRRERWR
jgi:hypothetical protein